MKIADQFPDLYSLFLPDFFHTEINREEIANCANCVMLRPENPVAGQEYFSNDSKCCTFFPDIPNYLIGYLLSDDSGDHEKGKQIILKIISSGLGVTPKGITPGKKYSHLYKISRESSFGKSSSLICPFYDKETGNCNMWSARTAICTTYFCRYNNGKDGENFWATIKQYIQKTEDILSDYVLFLTDQITVIDVEPPNTEFSLQDIDNIRPDNYREIWGDWYGKELEFYMNSYAKIKALNKKQFSDIMGFSGDFQIEKIKAAFNILKNTVIPELMVLNPEISIRPKEDEDFIILSDSGVFKISELLFKVLTKFDGNKKTADIIQYFQNEEIEIEEDLLISFHQHRILLAI